MAHTLQALIISILHHLLLTASMLLAEDGSPSGGYSFNLKHSGKDDQEHHMTLQIGKSPPVSAVVDTGSDLIWLQHDKCSSDPMDCPRNTSSGNTECDKLMSNMHCCNGLCMFERVYGGSQYARGFMVKSKVDIVPDKTHEDLTVGCTVDISCTNGDNKKQDCTLYGTGGIVGLGRGKMSLLSQLKLEQKKFSFCLTDYRGPKLTSEINFGNHASAPTEEAGYGKVEFVYNSGALVPAGDGPPLVDNKFDDHKYYVRLAQILMGTEDLDGSIGGGVMLIDSGSPVSRLPQAAFEEVEKHVKSLMDGKNMTPKENPSNQLHACYVLDNEPPTGMPEMVLLFKGNAKMHLPAERYLLVDKKMKEVCLAILPGHLTLGNFQMQSMSMLFNLTEEPGTLAFWPDHCASHAPS